MATSILHISVEQELEARATETLDGIGLSMAQAVEVLLSRIASQGRFPLELPLLDELDRVRLRADVRVTEGVLPVGSEGTIVHRYADGKAFEVEFARPVEALVTLRADEIFRING